MSVLPDPGASRAVLVGTSRYQHLEQLPAVSNNLQALAGLLSGPLSLQLPAQHVTVVENPAAAHTVVREVREAAAEATDTLVVYFAGHGLIDSQDTLSLALPHTEFGCVETGLPYDWLRQVLLLDSCAERHVVILDCCYSGRALGRMSASPGLANQAAVEGSYLLAATAETRTALAPVGDTYTAFTGALLETLRHGIPGGPELLDLGTIYRHLRLTLGARGHPIPQARDRNSGAQVALGRNHAALPVSSPAAPPGAEAAWRPRHDRTSIRTGPDSATGPQAQPWEYDHSPASAEAQPDSRSARTGTSGEQVGIPGVGRSGRGPRIALIGTACLALLAGGGLLTWNHLHKQKTQEQPSRASGLSDPSTSVSPAVGESALTALNNAKKKKGLFVIGVKDDQPGMSTNIGNDPLHPNWTGAEIEYAKLITEHMKIPKDNIRFQPIGTESREAALERGSVQMAVGTYGINPERLRRVDFAGPYYQAIQNVMLRKGDGNNEAYFRNTSGMQGSSKATSIYDLRSENPDAPLCTVKASTSEARLKELGFTHVSPLTDYNNCMKGLREKDGNGEYEYDGVVTDEPILAGLKKDSNKRGGGVELMIARDGFGTEEYGIGLPKGNPTLKGQVCEAIRKIKKDGMVEKLYKEDVTGVPLQKIPDPSRFCPTPKS
ncbi:transporter substrate-binding domain-containing protein [Streptomyces sp. NPDC048669]|uniref:caspase, EACC1-associated type n=1 Tax=Streptomyces sp. NPDC048669 TaxID=3155267 RepID=UPI00342D92A3